MIVTVTANPALDRTLELAAPLAPGTVQAATAVREDAGGKGINVARVIAAAGASTLAVLPLAASDPLSATLHASRVPARSVRVAHHARANLTLTDPAGETTKVNLPGAALEGPERAELIAVIVDAARGASWLALCGSLPPGAGDDFYVDVIRAVRAAHGDAAPRIAVDTSGPALAAAVADAHPDLIKPNEHELAELAGVALHDAGDLEATVRELADRIVPDRVAAALVTLGGEGAVLIDADGAWRATPPPIVLANTVGAGDSSLAGYLLASVRGLPVDERLALAVRYGSAAAALPGTQAPSPRDLPDGEVPVHRISTI